MVGMRAIVNKLWKMILQTCVSSPDSPVQDPLPHFHSSASNALPTTSINDSSSSSEAVMSEQSMNVNGIETHSSSNKNLCPICLDPLGEGNGDDETIFTSQCSHSFHFTCISSNVRHGSTNCPVCRSFWSQLPCHANIRTDPVLRMLDESIATVRIQRSSALNNHNHDYPIQHDPPRLLFSVVYFPNKSRARMSCSLSVTLNHSPAIDLVLVATPNGPHLRLIKHCMALVIYSLRPIDRVAIVTNFTAVRVFPFRRMTPYGKQTALQVIDRLFYSELSDPIEGIRKGIKIIRDRAYKNPKCSILHLSNSRTRTYQCTDDEHPVQIHRFQVGYGHDSSNGYVVNEFREFLPRVVGVGITEVRLKIGDDGRIVEIGEMWSGDESRIPLKFQEWRKVRVDYSYRVYSDGGGAEDSYITGEVVVDGSHPFEGTSNGCESLDYCDPFRTRRWAKYLNG